MSGVSFLILTDSCTGLDTGGTQSGWGLGTGWMMAVVGADGTCQAPAVVAAGAVGGMPGCWWPVVASESSPGCNMVPGRWLKCPCSPWLGPMRGWLSPLGR